MLTAGHRLWGYANDDFHDPDDFGNAWNMVRVEEVVPAAIIAAARAGHSYATTGLLLEEFSIDEKRIRVDLTTLASGKFIGPEGKQLAAGDGTPLATHKINALRLSIELVRPSSSTIQLNAIELHYRR